MTVENESPSLDYNLSQDAILRRYGRRFPGYRLSNYGRVALPIFRIHVSLLKITRKKIPVLHEFVLRSIDSGLSHAADLAGFLGLERVVVNSALSELATTEDIILTGTEGDRSHRLIITEQGRGTLSSATLEKLEEDIEVIYFDGLSRRIIHADEEQFLRPQEVRKAGMIELAPYPRSRPDVEDFQEELRRDFKLNRPDFDLVAILGVERVQTFFRSDAIIITYRPDAPMDDASLTTQIGFVVGGHWSEDHAVAFRRSNADSRVPIQIDLSSNEIVDSAILAFEVPSNLYIEEENDEQDIKDAQPRMMQARKRGNRKDKRRRKDWEVSDGQNGPATQELGRSVKEYFRTVEPYDHAEHLEDALAHAVDRLVIIAPEITLSVVNHNFISSVEKALKRKVQVYIGYEVELDKDMASRLAALESRFGNFIIRKITQASPRILLCDGRFCILTSFKWLSFRSSIRNAFRDDRGYLIDIESYINSMFDKYVIIINSGLRVKYPN